MLTAVDNSIFTSRNLPKVRQQIKNRSIPNSTIVIDYISAKSSDTSQADFPLFYKVW